MASSSSSSLQRQRRVRLERTVSLKFKDLEGFCTELSENISMGGMLLRAETPQSPGTLFDFELTLEEGGPLIQGIGEVVWVRGEDEVPGMPGGMGVRFLELAPGSRALIYQVVDQHISRGGQPFELHESPAPEALTEIPETAPVPDLPPEPRPVRAGSYAVLASPQRKRDEAPDASARGGSTRGGARRRSLPGRRSSRGGPWVGVGVVTILAVAAIALWYGYGLWFGAGGQSEFPEPEVARVDESGTDARRDPLASVVPMETPEDSAEDSTEPADVDTGELAQTPSPEPDLAEPELTEIGPVEAEPVEPEPVESPAPATAAAEARTQASATALRDIAWRRRGDGLEVTVSADGPFRDGWNHFRMNEGTPRVVVRLIGIREPFRPTLSVDEPELRQIRTGRHRRAGGDELHVVLDLASSRVALAEIEAEGSRLRLLLREMM